MILAADCLWQSTASGLKIKIFLCLTRKDTPFIHDLFVFADYHTNKIIMGTLAVSLMPVKGHGWQTALYNGLLQGANKSQSQEKDSSSLCWRIMNITAWLFPKAQSIEGTGIC